MWDYTENYPGNTGVLLVFNIVDRCAHLVGNCYFT